MYIKIYDKDEKDKTVMFIINIFDSQQNSVLKKIKEAIERVWKIEDYSQEDLREELNKFGVNISIVYDSEEQKIVELPF